MPKDRVMYIDKSEIRKLMCTKLSPDGAEQFRTSGVKLVPVHI